MCVVLLRVILLSVILLEDSLLLSVILLNDILRIVILLGLIYGSKMVMIWTNARLRPGIHCYDTPQSNIYQN